MTKKSVDNGDENRIMDVIKELWEAAVNLRGSIEPSDYKRYVLPVIFLRFLSLGYEKRRDELLEELKDEDTKTVEYMLEDPDQYRMKGVFIVPKEARWDYLLKHAQADDIKLKMDNALELLENTYPEKLRGLLPRIYASSNLSRENVTGLINLFSKDVFKRDYHGEDLIGRVYEYFIGEFASSEGKRGGEYFTPSNIVRTLVSMLEPKDGDRIFDPCCGSGGMFVQSDLFTQHRGKLSFYGVESKDFTYRLCRMNLFIHGLDGDILLGNSYAGEKHSDVKADIVIANPPFNDGSKSKEGWGVKLVKDNDPRLVLGHERMPITPKNGNTMWMMHFLYHVKEGGTAGFVMATGELSNSENARFEVRKQLVEQDFVDCIVRMPGQLFANTGIPCSLWFLSRNKDGRKGYRKRNREVLFIDARNMAQLIPGSRKQKYLTDEEIQKIAQTYHQFKKDGVPEEVPGFCKVVTIEDIQKHKYILTPGRYVGVEDEEEDDEPFENQMERLIEKLKNHFAEGRELETHIQKNLEVLLYDK